MIIKIQKTWRYELTQAHIDLLADLEKEGIISYDDLDCEDLKDFRAKVSGDQDDIDRFMDNNHGGTLGLMTDLCNCELAEDVTDEDAWKGADYQITEFGKNVLEAHSRNQPFGTAFPEHDRNVSNVFTFEP